MNDDEKDLRRRFHELRAVEGRSVPPFPPHPARRSRLSVPRLMLAAASLVLVVTAATFALRAPRPAGFDRSDIAAARTMASWQPPTDFLLHTPGHALITATPSIPDPAALAPLKGSS